MSALREELHQLVEGLSEDDLSEVKDFVKVLLKEPDELTDDELADLDGGQKEIRQGDWTWLEDVKRNDV